jgi:DNA polymerase (family 10)
VHSEHSDGRDSIEEIARAAKKLGYKFVAITDHSKTLHIAHGLTGPEVRKQLKEIASVNRKVRGIKVLSGTEVDIMPDGSLDLPDDLLADLDVVIASVHSGFKQPREKITARIAGAMRNPNVDILAHPTGRLIGKRAEYDVDVPEIIRTAAATHTAIEINANPERLDLNDVYCRMAKEQGVKLAIGTDAHDLGSLGLMELGVSVARRGWLEAKNVLNTQTKPKLK